MNVPFYFLLTLLFFAFLYVTGWTLAKSMRAHPLGVPLAIAIGIAFWVGVSFVLCLVGGYRPRVLQALFWGVLFIAFVRLGRRWSEVRETITAGLRVPVIEICALLLLLALPWLMLAIMPNVSFDAEVYHLLVPKLYLAAGGFRDIPYLVYSNWPIAFELLYGWGLGLQDFVLAKLTHWGCAVLLAFSLFRYCETRGHGIAGLLAIVLYFASPVAMLETPIAYVDLGQALFFFLAFVLWDEALEATDLVARRRCLVIAGILLGIVAGSKLTGLVAAIVMTLCHVGFARRSGRLLPELVMLLGIPVALWAPWAIRSFVATGNPVYPALYDWFGGPYFSPELAATLTDWHANSIGMGRGFWDYVMLPYRIVFESSTSWTGFHGELSRSWAVGFPLAILGAVWIPRCRRLLVVGLLFGVFWALTSQQLRLLLPALPFFAVAAALALATLVRRFLRVPAGLLRRVVWVACAAMVVLYVIRPPTAWDFRLGRGGGLRSHLKIGGTLEFINQKLPANAKLMFVDAMLGFFCEREFVADSFAEASQMNAVITNAGDLAGLQSWFRANGITHVLITKNNPRVDALPDYFTNALADGRGFDRVYEGAVADIHAVRRDP